MGLSRPNWQRHHRSRQQPFGHRPLRSPGSFGGCGRVPTGRKPPTVVVASTDAASVGGTGAALLTPIASPAPTCRRLLKRTPQTEQILVADVVVAGVFEERVRVVPASGQRRGEVGSRPVRID